ncbi:MAG: hypothetical protein JO266_11395 [Acidobacteria bacterium]|nr:hypothetical protein [Acidobacteriota bacterium]
MRSYFAFRVILPMAFALVVLPSIQAVGEQPSGSGEIPERFLGLFQSGEQIMEIQPSRKEGEVQISIKGGMAGTTDLLGHVSQDGKLHATGQSRFCTLFGGCDTFMCNLVGAVNGTRLTGTYECIPVEKSNAVGAQFEHRQYRKGPGNINFQKFVPEHVPH